MVTARGGSVRLTIFLLFLISLGENVATLELHLELVQRRRDQSPKTSPTTTMAGARSAVLNLYKRLHRTSQSVFAGDTRMIEGARAKIKEDFWKNRNVTSAGALKELMQVGEDSIKVLRTSVIQAVATDTVDPQTGKPIYRYSQFYSSKFTWKLEFF